MTNRDKNRVLEEIEVLKVRFAALPDQSATPDVPLPDSEATEAARKSALELSRALKRFRDKS